MNAATESAADRAVVCALDEPEFTADAETAGIATVAARPAATTIAEAVANVRFSDRRWIGWVLAVLAVLAFALLVCAMGVSECFAKRKGIQIGCFLEGDPASG